MKFQFKTSKQAGHARTISNAARNIYLLSAIHAHPFSSVGRFATNREDERVVIPPPLPPPLAARTAILAENLEATGAWGAAGTRGGGEKEEE